MKPFEYYKRKETALNKALSKCESRLKQFQIFANSVKEWTAKEHKAVERWNDWHDLKYRIEQRLIENYYNFQHQNFVQNGFAVYSL
jgi:hypothetical protein